MNYIQETMTRVRKVLGGDDDAPEVQELKTAGGRLVDEVELTLGDKTDVSDLSSMRNDVLIRTTSRSPADLGRDLSYALTALICAADAVRYARSGQNKVARDQAKHAYNFARVAVGEQEWNGSL